MIAMLQRVSHRNHTLVRVRVVVQDAERESLHERNTSKHRILHYEQGSIDFFGGFDGGRVRVVLW
jgi:hypothetical protein